MYLNLLAIVLAVLQKLGQVDEFQGSVKGKEGEIATKKSEKVRKH